MAPSPDPEPAAPASAKAPAAPRRGIWGWARFNETAISGLVVGVVAGLILFNLNENSNRITRIEENQQEIAQTLATLVALFDRFEADIDTRFAKFEADIDTRFADIDTRFAKLEADIDTRFAAVDARFAKLEAAVDTRFAKLEENQQEIAQTLATLVALFKAHDEGER